MLSLMFLILRLEACAGGWGGGGDVAWAVGVWDMGCGTWGVGHGVRDMGCGYGAGVEERENNVLRKGIELDSLSTSKYLEIFINLSHSKGFCPSV